MLVHSEGLATSSDKLGIRKGPRFTCVVLSLHGEGVAVDVCCVR